MTKHMRRIQSFLCERYKMFEPFLIILTFFVPCSHMTTMNVNDFLIILTYFVLAMMILIILLLLFTVIQAKRTVSKRFENNSDVDYPMIEDNESEEDSEIEPELNSVSAEFSEYMDRIHISPEYIDKNILQQTLDQQRKSSATSVSRSRSNSEQQAIDAVNRIMFSKPTENENDNRMDVVDTINIAIAPDDCGLEDMETIMTSLPHPSLRRRSRRLSSLQNIQE